MSCCLRTFWTIRTAALMAHTRDRSSGRLSPAHTSLTVRVPALFSLLGRFGSLHFAPPDLEARKPVCGASGHVSDGANGPCVLLVPTSAETQVCFKYYHGATGALRATTPSVTIRNGCAAVSPGGQSSTGPPPRYPLHPPVCPGGGVYTCGDVSGGVRSPWSLTGSRSSLNLLLLAQKG